MIELAVTAFRVQDQINKSLLWEKIQNVLNKFLSPSVFAIDIYLKQSLQRDYTEISVNDLTFFSTKFCNFSISSTVFLNCYFKNCEFNTVFIQSTSFINCTFDNCSVMNSEFLDNLNEITTIGCSQKRCSILIEEAKGYTESKFDLVSDTEKEVLNRLWAISNTKGHHIVQLLNHFGRNKKKGISIALKSLEEKGYIRISGIYVQFVTNKIHVIKEILEIGNEIQS